jgi:Ca2+-binding RTX toxin-like protein
MPAYSTYRPTSSGPYNGYYFTFGTDAPEWFFGSDVNDWIDGGGGNDVILAGGGDDVLHGGAGDDYLAGGDGYNELHGGDGNDTFVVGTTYESERFYGGAGIDTLSFTQLGTNGITIFMFNGVATDIGNWSGIENIRGTEGNDTIWGDAGDNRIEGLGGDNSLNGVGGNDVLIAGDGDDILQGGDGDDILDGGWGHNILDGGDGNDVFHFRIAYGRAFGGEGIDTVSFEGNTYNDHVSADLLLWGDTLHSIEILRGAVGNNELSGDAGDNRIEGLGGNDTLDGRDGNDTLEGGLGDDTLRGAAGSDTQIGGDGADRFLYATWTEGDDIIADFTVGVDRIALSGSGFGLTSLDEIDFFVGTDVHATERAALLYNPETGVLAFDLDGEFGSDAVMLATLTGLPEITKDDFILV